MPRQVLHLVTFNNDPEDILHADLSQLETPYKEAVEYHHPMRDLCVAKGGIGLAANQAGLRMNMFFADKAAKLTASPHGEICINPSYEPVEGTQVLTGNREGCLSIPKALFKVNRFSVIDARWTNGAGHTLKRRLKGVASVMFQHECDHLRGITLLESGEVTAQPAV